MTNFNVDTSQLTGLGQMFQEVRELRMLGIYKKFYIHYRERTRDRYLRVADQTPYSPYSLGRKKEKSGEVITQQSLFGIDGWDTYGDVTQNVKITDAGLEVWTDQDYAEDLFEIIATKGPFAPDAVLFLDELDRDVLEEVIIDEIGSIFQ